MVAHNTLTPDVETSSDDYRRRFAGPLGRYLLNTQTAALRRLLVVEGTRPLRVLEVGGGHAQLTPGLLADGHEVWVQGSDDSCGTAIRTLAARHAGRVHFVTSSLWELPFGPRSFDVVIAVRLLAHVERWRELLRELVRVADRHVIVDYAALSGWNILTPLVFHAKRAVEGNTRPYFCYWGGELLREFRSLGCHAFGAKKQFFWPMGVHRAHGAPALGRGLESIARALGLTRLFGSPVLLRASRAEQASGEGVS